MKELTVKTSQRTQFVDITSRVQELVREEGEEEGICHLYVPHTTAGLTINENADPAVSVDIINTLNNVIPFDGDYRHLEGNSAAHIKASLMGPSLSVLIKNNRLVLGTWQGIFFCEFDGPRSRRIYVKVL
ncbi:MAG: YjbQ family protein [Candidatus Syntrophonatronum acetioxidans]|uniref:YjbQ family protein n=1 Tax=Candidatus Syntrophonatronum acetioxidans TaxID=1795816 RepID=A0A424YIQ6_9FIRM|nr:MAG: YjbQ family protein [Candidatus Syntrophonatronum acetioxidans]